MYCSPLTDHCLSLTIEDPAPRRAPDTTDRLTIPEVHPIKDPPAHLNRPSSPISNSTAPTNGRLPTNH
jgi:hypothetical protein